ncbi:hypothetical protein [Solirubrobacter soli]|uniref:hypothetical protein n=1 Tax=Solirubrobacter soli TaxID=363832 RepID=UPI000421AD62|nr:hypothetical protein [Solirubrobacter soli]
MTAWATDLEFAYDHGHLYVVDAETHWSEAEVDVRMPRSANFFVPLRVEAWGGRPPLDLDAWDQVTEFSLTVPSGKLALASAGIEEVTVGIAPGAYRARWSGRNLSEAAEWEGDDPPDTYRLQIWPGATEAPRAEIKHWPGIGRSELGDLPALLADEDLDALGAVLASERTGDALRLNVRLAGAKARTWDRTIRADGVVRWVVSSSRFHRAALHAEHPGLLPYADDFGGLSFHGRAEDPERLAHALRAAHAEIADGFIGFEEVVNALLGVETLLKLGYGQLANGPITLLRRYAEVAHAHGVQTQMTITGPGREGLCLLELGESYVIAERFTAS